MLSLFYFILALFLLVTVHEFGHFFVARRCGVRVLRFSFGFGPVLWRYYDKYGTEYAWSLIPLGGYVKMLDESEGMVAESDLKFAFNRQSLVKRSAIVAAGPVFNFAFAFAAYWVIAVMGTRVLVPMVGTVVPDSVAAHTGFKPKDRLLAIDGKQVKNWQDVAFYIFSGTGTDIPLAVTVQNQKNPLRILSMSLHGWVPQRDNFLEKLGIIPFIPEIPPVIGQVVSPSPAFHAGLRADDTVLAIDGHAVHDWMEMMHLIQKHPDAALSFTLLREGKNIYRTITLGAQSAAGVRKGYLGILSKPPLWSHDIFRLVQETPWNAVFFAAQEVSQMTFMTVSMFEKMLWGKISLQHISGPIGIAQGASASAHSGFRSFLGFLALLSISLGVLNLIPLPMLDGGHLLFFIIEKCRGKPLSDTVLLVSNYVGIIFLVLLMFYAFVNDLTRLAG